MITCRYLKELAESPASPLDVSEKNVRLSISLSEESINQFKVILSRALNTVPPECPEYADWFALLDKLDPIIKSS